MSLHPLTTFKESISEFIINMYTFFKNDYATYFHFCEILSKENLMGNKCSWFYQQSKEIW